MVSKREGYISSDEWVKLRPFMVMIHIDDWAEIKQASYENCRYAGEKCNLVVKSIDSAVLKLDRIIKQTLGGKF